MAKKKRKEKSDMPRWPSWNARATFTCPVGVGIAWHRGLMYSECPLVPGERDMGACARCPLKGENAAIDRNMKDKKLPHIDVKRKTKKDIVPKIDGTYVSK